MTRMWCSIRYKWPLRTLKRSTNDFNQGNGPLSSLAETLVTIQVQVPANYTWLRDILQENSESDSILIYFYDRWAEWAERLQRLDSISFEGTGILVKDNNSHNDQDTQYQEKCLVVAESHILESPVHECEIRMFHKSGLRYAKTSDQVVEYRSPDETTSHTLKQMIQARKTATSMDGRSKYKYPPLVNLQIGDANLYGVVVYATFPTRLKNGNFMRRVFIVDPSLPNKDEALAINIFAKTREELPKIFSAGDIIRFHKLEIRWPNNIEGASRMRKTRHLVIREEVGMTDDPKMNYKISSSTNNYTFDQSDYEKCRELFEWRRMRLAQDPTTCGGVQLSTIEQIFQNHRNQRDPLCHYFIDAVFKVIDIHTIHSQNAAEKVIQRIELVCYDGTGKGARLKVLLRSGWDEANVPNELAEHVKTRWVRFRNLTIESTPENRFTPVGFLSEKASFLIIPDYSHEVQRRLDSLKHFQKSTVRSALTRENDIVLQAKRPRMTETIDSLISVSVPPPVLQIGISSLAHVATLKETPHKFHCFVHVAEVFPTDFSELTVFDEELEKYVYQFVLRVGDETGGLDVIVYNEDGDTFFHDVPACNLKENPQALIKVEQKIKKLLSLNCHIHCCIKSYRISEHEVRFRVFDTRLVN